MIEFCYPIIQKINRFLAESMGYLIAVIVILLVVDTAGYLFHFRIPALVELAVFAVIASAYLGLSYTEEKRGHVRVDAVISRLPKRYQEILNIIWNFVGLVVVGITTYAAYLKAYEAFIDGEAIAGEVPLPLFPIRSIIAVCLLLYTIQVLFNLILDIRKKK